MKITKDEARILCAALEESQFELCRHTSKDRKNAALALEKLLNRLSIDYKDKRRMGRTSMDDFTDCMDRFVAKELQDENNN
jgi:hypothetical protein